MTDLIFSQNFIQELTTGISESVSQTVHKDLQTYLQTLQPSKEQTEYLTRKEVAKVLNVSLPTILSWTKSGKITGYRISSRVRFKRNEIEGCLSEIKTRK